MRVPIEVGGDQVRRELDALELAADRLGERLDRHRLGQAGHALDEDVTTSQERDDEPFEQLVLADDELLHLVTPPAPSASAAAGGWSMGVGLLGSVTAAGLPAAPPAAPIGTAKPMPTKKPCSDGLARAVTMPTTWPARLSSGPPELPGLTAASNWMRPSGSVRPATGMVRSGRRRRRQ